MGIIEEARVFVRRKIYSRPGRISRFLQNPNPLNLPYQCSQVDLVRDMGLGDVLMCTPAIRELKRLNPDCRVRFFTDFAPLVRGLPYINEVGPTQSAPRNARRLGYEGRTPPKGNLARIIGDSLGINVTDIRPDCVVNPALVEEYRMLLKDFPKPHVLVLRRASKWTPNKDWPDTYWNIVTKGISRTGTVIEIGGASGPRPDSFGSYLDWRGTTTLEQMVAAVAAGDLYIGPVSGPMHVAAAVGTPRVVIYGGYEHPIGSQGYELLPSRKWGTQINLYSAVACSPCWLTDACPYDRKCLTMISPGEVLSAVSTILGDVGGELLKTNDVKMLNLLRTE